MRTLILSLSVAVFTLAAFGQVSCPTADPCDHAACYVLPALQTSLTFTSPADFIYSQKGNTLISVPTEDEWLPMTYMGQLHCGWIRVGGGTPPYTFTANGLPSGLTLNEQTGQLTGRALRTPRGVYTVTFTAGDAAGAIVTITRQMQVCGGKLSQCDGFGNETGQ